MPRIKSQSRASARESPHLALSAWSGGACCFPPRRSNVPNASRQANRNLESFVRPCHEFLERLVFSRRDLARVSLPWECLLQPPDFLKMVQSCAIALLPAIDVSPGDSFISVSNRVSTSFGSFHPRGYLARHFPPDIQPGFRITRYSYEHGAARFGVSR
jgi:hypothetical protein